MASASLTTEEDIKGPPTVRTMAPGHIMKLSGEVVYRTGDPLNVNLDDPLAGMLGEKLYTLDPQAALKARTTGPLKIPEAIAKPIQDDLMAHNDFARMYRWTREMVEELQQKERERAAAENRPEEILKCDLILLSNRQAAEAGIFDSSIHPHRSENFGTGEAVSLC